MKGRQKQLQIKLLGNSTEDVLFNSGRHQEGRFTKLPSPPNAPKPLPSDSIVFDTALDNHLSRIVPKDVL
ncbi:hypothetical protein PVK06_023165 [Gossypium arboreum]|uniref:Uncharacterized protein n=1 Tax=Gossypium arboreum TaxID=29729 RepID=A0ABR0PAL1_GOSAR|nr:hypothetical protein PVK06_023165 [Gossypium arboreum]